MVDAVISSLNSRADHGIRQFRSILHSLVNWSEFNPYYFEKIKKLDRATADRTIAHLKQLVEIRDAKIREDREARIRAEQEKQKPKNTLEELRTRFLQLTTENASAAQKQKRGYELESILIELARLSNLTVIEPFRNSGEQIDGAFKFEGENYLLEAKWQNREMNNESLYQFAGKTEGKMYGRGVFVSVNGFSEGAVDMLVRGKALKTVLVDGEDLIHVLENSLTFAEMVDKKVAAAQSSGNIYVHSITGRSKI
ncbi:MAG: restriction endonuclease [Pyrinomonadaceae bacterium]